MRISILCTLILVHIIYSQKTLFLNESLDESNLATIEKEKYKSIKGFKEHKKVKLFRLDEKSLVKGEIEVPLLNNQSETFSLEKVTGENLWKGRKNGKIKMSLRKVKDTYVGYLYSGFKYFKIMGISKDKLVLIEVERNFKCGVKE